MNSQKVRQKFLSFFMQKAHQVVPPASLVSEDSTTLFTTAGMQQFKQYYLAPELAPAPRLVTIQPCFRTSDIQEVGDEKHLTFFEMLGNFGFNDYFKKEAIGFAWEFLTKELKIPASHLIATYFAGEKGLPEDHQSLAILKTLKGLKKIVPGKIEDNFWSLNTEGSPGGPTVEFYLEDVEIWNLVFNQYLVKQGAFQPAKYQGVDTGMGLERLVAVLEEKRDLFETEFFLSLIKTLESLSGQQYSNQKRSFRIIADHTKAATFLIAEGVLPSNKEHGYLVRRLIRRAVVKGHQLGIQRPFLSSLLPPILDFYREVYPQLSHRKQELLKAITEEEGRFQRTLGRGLREFQKMAEKEISGKILFDLYQTYGFPLELSLELIKEHHLVLSPNYLQEFEEEKKKHQEASRIGAGLFKSGLASFGPQETKYHTATHLLLAALRLVLGKEVVQKGSNITASRLRFDFAYPRKLTEEELKKVEELVNQKIQENLPVTMEELSLQEAKQKGALGVFEHKYGERVRVYRIGQFSKEICAGPHVQSTGQLGVFRIIKEEASSAGIRRIKAVLE